MGKGVELTGKNKEKIYPITASDLVYDKDTKKNIKTSLNEKVEEAPMDGKQYARLNGAWAEVEAGAVSETALITLTPAVDGLKGVSVTVTTSEGETVLNTTWQGAALTAQIRAGLQYTVAVGSKDGFIAPNSVTYTAERGVSRSINMAYTESKLKVNILSNQSNDTTIAAVKATVKYGSTTVQVANGGEVYLPLNVDVTITFPAVDGYLAPDTITYTHTGGSYEKSGTYQTELVTVNVSADNGVSMDGQIVTLSSKSGSGPQAGDGSEFYSALPVSGGKVTCKIPFGVTYYVSSSAKDGYTTPSSQSATASQSSRNFNLVYTYNPLGVFIQGVSGKLYNPDDWTSQETPNGIAVLAENCSFVMALEDAYSSDCQWGEYGTTVSGITSGNSISIVTVDYDGEAQTTTILEQLGNNSTNAPAAYHCRAYTFPNGKKGYLGALGEWLAVIDNKDAIVSALSKCGGTAMSDYYWTSTQNNSELSWLAIIKYDTPDTNDKNVNYSVRALCSI